MSGTLKMDGEKTGYFHRREKRLSFVPEKPPKDLWRKEHGLGNTTLNKFFIQKSVENTEVGDEDKWEVLSQNLESFHQDDIQDYEQQMKKFGTQSNCHLSLLTNRKECFGNNFVEFNKIKDVYSFTDKSELEEMFAETDRHDGRIDSWTGRSSKRWKIFSGLLPLEKGLHRDVWSRRIKFRNRSKRQRIKFRNFRIKFRNLIGQNVKG